jgi:hypothetical protein
MYSFHLKNHVFSRGERAVLSYHILLNLSIRFFEIFTKYCVFSRFLPLHIVKFELQQKNEKMPKTLENQGLSTLFGGYFQQKQPYYI